MKNLDCAIVTPSYAPDFERCKLLAWSVEQQVAPEISHYIIVPAQDFELFKPLRGQRTELITVESILPWWIQRIPMVKNGWISFKTGFIRNWLLQQIVKIKACLEIEKETLIFVDSDTAFIRPFDLSHLMQDEQMRLYRLPGARPDDQFKWYQSAYRLLGLPDTEMSTARYITQVVPWQRKHVLNMLQQIEQVTHRSWIEAVSTSWHFSEYVLYAIFVEEILKEQSLHYCDRQSLCYEYWFQEDLSERELQNFFAGIEPQQVSVMISAKANIPVQRYETFIRRMAQPEFTAGTL
jgi:hypothetical protein